MKISEEVIKDKFSLFCSFNFLAHLWLDNGPGQVERSSTVSACKCTSYLQKTVIIYKQIHISLWMKQKRQSGETNTSGVSEKIVLKKRHFGRHQKGDDLDNRTRDIMLIYTLCWSLFLGDNYCTKITFLITANLRRILTQVDGATYFSLTSRGAMITLIENTISVRGQRRLNSSLPNLRGIVNRPLAAV